ncbi:MAG: hypothetical protein HDS46_06910 [Bacteroides sp.]|nr:hypothetical protein [Bacteroidales bacterium]MBD5260482.1 hypothetical protein [Bacteroides sp.]
MFEGEESSKYICEYCGTTASSISSLTSSYCTRHPNGSGKGKHSPFEGGIKSSYTCKYCGRSASSLSSLTSSYCTRHPNGSGKGKHSPLK